LAASAATGYSNTIGAMCAIFSPEVFPPMKSICCLAAILGLTAVNAAAACDLREAYVARLGPADHFNSNGERLTAAAAIIRQDRANYHLFGKRDPEDEGDRFFASKENRAILERLLENGRSSPGVLAEIVNGTPLVEVQVCRGNRGDYVDVLVKQ
jgi:hypothetical protein